MEITFESRDVIIRALLIGGRADGAEFELSVKKAPYELFCMAQSGVIYLVDKPEPKSIGYVMEMIVGSGKLRKHRYVFDRYVRKYEEPS